MKKNILLAISLSIYTLSFAQAPKVINSIEALTDSIAMIVKKRNIPGLMLGITTKDSILFSGGFGYADVSLKQLVTGETRFRMGSVTKSFIAIAIQKLVEKGELNLNDELKKIAPEVPFVNRWEYSNPIRIIDLLENTTGFDDFKLNRMYTLEKKYYSSKELMMMQKPSMICRWAPSERYTYSNVNYVILGYLISKISGKEYDQYIKENILSPLSMKNSNFDLWSKFTDINAKEYIISEGRFQKVPSVTLLPGPAGSLWSSSNDMIKFLQALLRRGDPILKSQSMQIIESPQSSLAAKGGLVSGYALGNEDFGNLRGHDGTLGTFSSSYRYSSELGIGFVIASNANGLGNIESLIYDYFTKNSIFKPVQTKIFDKKAILPYLGYYQVEDPRFDLLSFIDKFMLVKIEIENDTLYFNIVGKKHKVLQTAPLTFIQSGSKFPGIFFTKNREGKRVLIINKHYTEKVNGFWAISWRITLFTMFLIATFSLLMGLVSLICFLLKKLKWDELQLRILPVIGIACLYWGIDSFIQVKNQSYMLYLLDYPSELSISIFLGITLFAVISILNFILILKRLRKIKHTFIKWSYFLIACSLLTITFVLISNGWVGLMTWRL